MSKKFLSPTKDVQNQIKSQRGVNSTVVFWLIMFLGIVLRFYNLGAESYWIDEMSTVVEGQQSFQQIITSGRMDQPPAYYLPFQLWVQTFGAGEVSTRSFSVLAGIGSIFLLFLIGRELFGKTVALLSAFLMAISEFQIYYSQQARFYSFFELTSLLSFLFFILALQSKRKIYFAIYSLTGILVVYSHAYGIFVLAAQALFFVLQWKRNKDVFTAWFISQFFIFIVVAFYFYPVIFGGVGGAVGSNIGTGISPPLLRDPLRTVYRFIMSARGERTWGVMFVNYVVAMIVFLVGTLTYAVRQGKTNLLTAVRRILFDFQEVPDAGRNFLLVSCWLLCPIMLPFLLSKMVGPMYLDRYMISAAPALYLLIALGIFSIRKLVPMLISLSVLIIMIAPSLNYYYAIDSQEQWKEAAEYVDKNSEPGDVIVFAPNQGIGIQQKTFNWYYPGVLTECGLGGEDGFIDSEKISDSLAQCISGHERFWVVIRHYASIPGVADRYIDFFEGSDQTSMKLIKENHLIGISIYLFKVTKR